MLLLISNGEKAMRRNPLLLMIFLLIFAATGLPGASPQKMQKIVHESLQAPKGETGYHFGLWLKMPSAEVLKRYHLEGGAEIARVLEGSDAQKAGLKEGDIIIQFDGTPISRPEDLKSLLSQMDEEKDVAVVVNRRGKELIFTAHIYPQDQDEEEWMFQLPPRTWKFFMDSLPHFNMPQYWQERMEKGGYLGVEVEDLTDQLLQFFKADYGVLVKKVYKNSPADKAGIRAGDVIYKINDKKIEDTADLLRTLRYYDPGDKVDVYMVRNGKKKTVAVELGRRKPSGEWYNNFPPFFLYPELWRMKHFKGHILPHPEPKPLPPAQHEPRIYKF